jgi:hypothetical protein
VDRWGWGRLFSIDELGIFGNRIYSESVKQYEDFINSLAERMLTSSSEGSAAKVVCLFYLNRVDDIRKALHKREFEGTCFQIEYDKKINELMVRSERHQFHYNFSSGMWRHLESNEILGEKLLFGGQLGWRHLWLGADVTLQMRFINGSKDYQAVRESKLRSTNAFFGGYIGLDFIIEPVKFDKMQVEILGGMGYDEISGKDDDDYNIVINSLNLNIGLKPMLFLNREKSKYLALIVREHFLKYGTNGGSDLGGNALSIELALGWVKRPSALRGLRELHYFD